MNAKEPLEIAKAPHKQHCIVCEMMEESEYFYKEIRSEAKSRVKSCQKNSNIYETMRSDLKTLQLTTSQHTMKDYCGAIKAMMKRQSSKLNPQL
jgi:hypothetical protein